MKYLLRALRMALRYKYSFAASIFCSIVVAVLWGANISAIYPFVEIGFNNESPAKWAETRERKLQESIDELDKQIAEASTAADTTSRDAGITELETLRRKRESLEGKRATAAWMAGFAARYLPNDAFQAVVLVMVLVIISTVIKGCFLVTNTLLVARIGQRTVLDIQNMFFARTLDMELGTIGETGTGDLAGRIRGETGTIGAAITTLFGKTLREPLKMTACLVGATLVNWRLLLFSIIICPLAIYFLVLLAKATKRATRKAMEESAKLMNRLFQALTYIKVVKIFTRENYERRSFRQRARTVYKRLMRIQMYSALYRFTNELLGITIICLSVIAGGYLVLRQKTALFGIPMCAEPMTAGSMTLFYGFLIGAADPIRKLADVYNQLLAGTVAAGRVFPLIDRQPTIASPERPRPLPNRPASITFDNVWFGYRPDDPVLRGVSLHVEAGETIAILGANGSGKSTLANLLPRFFDPDQGNVTLDGVDVRQLRLKDLRRHVGLVTQKVMLFNDTVMDNIRYGNTLASTEDVIAAAKKAHAHDFIMNDLEDGYETIIGEHAGRLSGGQAQRLSLARTIIRDPQLLILDEATSQIDPKSEMLIRQTLQKFTRHRTTIMITHRLATLDLADRICLMEQGKIVDVGTHEELLQRCELYIRLRQTQFRESA